MKGPRAFSQAQTPAPSRSYDWRDDANCLGLDDMFVPDGSDAGTHVPDAIIRICAACPVIQQCLDLALTLEPKVEGYWAGTSHAGRRKLKPGDTPPVLTRKCRECGAPVTRLRSGKCDDCKAADARDRDAERRQANRDAVAS